MKSFFWKAICTQERYTGIENIRKEISKHGDIIDFKFFSNISINIIVEIQEYKINALYKDLSTVITIDPEENLNLLSDSECTLYINLTFIKSL